MEQQRRQGAHHEHEGQRPEREHEARTGIGFGERQRSAPEKAEHERGPVPGRFLERVERAVQGEKSALGVGRLQQHQSQPEGQQHAGDDRPPNDGSAVFAQGPGDGMQEEKPDETVKDEPCLHFRFCSRSGEAHAEQRADQVGDRPRAAAYREHA